MSPMWEVCRVMRTLGNVALRRLWIGLLGLLCSCGLILAQVDEASLVGTVKDTSGALVQGAQVTVVHRETNERVTKMTDEAGAFSIPALHVGSYSVTAAKDGFKTYVQEGIVLQVGQRARVDIALQLGSRAESVQVSADAVLTDTQTATLGDVIESKRVVDIPLNGRNPFDLVRLDSTVVVTATAFTARNYNLSSAVIGGGQGGSNAILLDGGSLNLPERGEYAVMPNVDAIQEFQVQTNGLSAEFGITGGGAVTMVSKSGSNQFSGTLYEFLRNSALDANGWTNNRAGVGKAPLRYNNFGGSLGGPVLLPKYHGRDKTFFFFNYDGYRYRTTTGAIYAHVPTAAERTGDFTSSYIKSPSTGKIIPVELYDPTTIRVNPNGSGYIADPFPSSVLPQSRLDPVAIRAISYIPLPNRAASDLTGTNNYAANAATFANNNQYNTRIDHQLTSNNKLFARYSYNIQYATGYSPTFSMDNIADPTGSLATRRGQNATLGYTSILSPTMLNDYRVTFSRELVLASVPGAGQNAPETLGLPSIIPSYQFPQFSISNMLNIGNRGDQTAVQAKNAWQTSDTFTRSSGRNTLKAGVDLRYHIEGTWQPASASGAFSFSNAMTGNPQDTSGQTGFGMATFMLGDVTGGSLGNQVASTEDWLTYSVFVQDDYKLTRRLTLNLGLRYDIITPPVERFNRYSNFNLNAINPLTKLPGEMQFANDGFGRSPVATDYDNVGPRFGFAYDIFGNASTVIRGGYGILYYDVGRYYSSPGTNGFSATTTFTNPSGPFPVFQLHNGPSSLVEPTGSSLGAATNLGNSVSATETNTKTPRVQQWNLSIQRQLPKGVLVNVAYAGNHGVHEVGNPYNLDVLNPQYLSLGLSLSNRVPNPFVNIMPAGSGLSSSTISLQQSLLEYPAYTAVSVNNPNYGDSIYHSLLVSAEKRFASGLSFLASYTKSKTLTDNTNSLIGFVGVQGTVTCGENGTYDRKLCRALAGQDVASNFVSSYVYELPFGKGKPFLGHGAAAYVVGGWQTNGILTIRGGLPLIVTGASNGANRLFMFTEEIAFHPVLLGCGNYGTDSSLLPIPVLAQFP